MAMIDLLRDLLDLVEGFTNPSRGVKCVHPRWRPVMFGWKLGRMCALCHREELLQDYEFYAQFGEGVFRVMSDLRDG